MSVTKLSSFISLQYGVARILGFSIFGQLLQQSDLSNSIAVLRSESPSGKCAKLHAVASSNNIGYMP